VDRIGALKVGHLLPPLAFDASARRPPRNLSRFHTPPAASSKGGYLLPIRG
jgi:hypothetical protein